MNACEQCKALDGQPSDVAPHTDLQFMGTFGFGTPGRMQEGWKKYRCDLCNSWARQHSEQGETPDQWELEFRIEPFYENGYQVHVEVHLSANSEQFEGRYSVRADGAGDFQDQIIIPFTRAPGRYPTKFQAWAAAVTLGQMRARDLQKH